jgi:LmbE family N-acetylglucosaminyl deacetylase
MGTKVDRRDFLKKSTALAAGAAIAPATLLTGCASVQIKPEGKGIDRILAEGARVLWIAAHPDDEILVGSIMARSSLYYSNPLKFLVLTHGDGGECCRPEGCLPDLATIRGRELVTVCEKYKAELQHERFFNAPLPVESFPKRHELAKIWAKHKDPTLVCAKAIREYKPDVIFTFGPAFGASGHPEHQLTSRFATAGVRMAADPKAEIDKLDTHRVERTYYGLNKIALIRALGGGDPEEPTEIFDATLPCKWGMSCYETMAYLTRSHRTQANDMGGARMVKFLMKKNHLRRVDPFTEIVDPFEPVA